MEPREWAAKAEREPRIPPGTDERFAGYGVFGVAFASGDVLAMRRFPASSVGPGYTSVWLRDAKGAWRIYTDGAPENGCPRYFGPQLEDAGRRRIDLAWTGPRTFTVTLEDQLRWDVGLRPTFATRMLNAMGSMMPRALWRSPSMMRVMARMAGPMLGAGHLTLTGRASNGQRFLANPLRVWTIAQSRAFLNGRDLGAIVRLPEQPALGDFRIPRAPMFAVGRSFFENFDGTRHVRATTRGQVKHKEGTVMIREPREQPAISGKRM